MKKNTRLIIIIVVVTLLIGAIVASQLRRRVHPVATVPIEFFNPLPNMPLSNFSDVSFSGTDLNIQNLPLLATTSTDKNTILDKLRDYCQTYDETDTSFSGTRCDFSRDYDNGYYSFVLRDSAYEGIATDLDLAKTKAWDFLEQFYTQPQDYLMLTGESVPNPDDFAVEDEFEYDDYWATEKFADLDFSDYETAEDFWLMYEEDPVPEEYGSISLSYVPRYESILVKKRYSAANKMYLEIGPDYQVADGLIDDTQLSFEPTTTYTLIPLAEATENIKLGYAFIDYGYPQYDLDYNLNFLSNVNLTDVTIEYRLDDYQTQAIPCYHFSGTAIDNAGEERYVEIITPAIEFSVAPAAQ